MMGLLLPEMRSPDAPKGEELSRRLAEALHPGRGETQGGEPQEKEIELDAAMTFSDREILQKMDFEQMSAEEIERAKQLIKLMTMPLREMPTRRFRGDPRGARADMRGTLRATLRSGGLLTLKWKSRRTRPPPLVIHRDRVHTFLFGTRLTNITRYLRYKDVDIALDKVAEAVEDWSGGTRIGQCLAEFNRRWSRRVLAQGAVVLFITDGLDRDAAVGLGKEMDRLHKSCRRLIWLNPLLRYEGFAPKSLGMRAILPHVDEFRPVHNLESLRELVDALSKPAPRRLEAAAAWRERGEAA
jgi:uncharacterized protein with von Willebrand factor type A (vWA) domain